MVLREELVFDIRKKQRENDIVISRLKEYHKNEEIKKCTNQVSVVEQKIEDHKEIMRAENNLFKKRILKLEKEIDAFKDKKTE